MSEEVVLCSDCGSEVPDTHYCIRCGSNLLKQDKSKKGADKIISFEIPKDPIKGNGNNWFEEPSLFVELKEPQQVISTLSPVEKGHDPELDDSFREIIKYQNLRVKLSNLLLEETISEDVFSRVYNNYSFEILRLSEFIGGKIAEYKHLLDNKRETLSKARMKHDELKLRVAVGELAEGDMLIRVPKIRDETSTLQNEVSSLENFLTKLDNLSIYVSSKEVFEYKQIIRVILGSIDELVSSEKISKSLGMKLKSDLEEAVLFYNRLQGKNGEAEMKLQNELEILDVRYQVGEITIEEMESSKKEIIMKLERLWEQPK
jgi:hypothetical protein